MRRYLAPFALALALVAVAIPFVALGAPPVPALELDLLALLGAVVKAVQGGQWSVAAVLAFVAAIWVLRKVGARFVPWLGTSEGGTVLALLTAVAGTLGTAALTGVGITWPLLQGALVTGVTAIGGYVALRRLVRPLIPLVQRIPRIGPWLARILALMSGADIAAKVQARAEAAFKPGSPSSAEIASKLGSPPAV